MSNVLTCLIEKIETSHATSLLFVVGDVSESATCDERIRTLASPAVLFGVQIEMKADLLSEIPLVLPPTGEHLEAVQPSVES
jgi:hypothetical protein